MDKLSDKIKYFQTLKEQENTSSPAKPSWQRTTSKLKIPSIFVSSNNTQESIITEEKPKVTRNLLAAHLDKNISQSVDVNLNLLDHEPKPITKSHSQVILSSNQTNEDAIESEENTERRSSGLHKSKGIEDLSAAEVLENGSTGLHKSKGFEDLPLANENESIILQNELVTPAEDDVTVRPRILDTVPKKIELTLTDDTNIEFRKRVNQIKANRTQSLIDEPKKTIHQINQEKLFIEKLNEIKGKRRSAEFNTSRTFVFDFTKKNSDKSQSVNNLSAINDNNLSNKKPFHKSSDDILHEAEEQQIHKEEIDIEKTKGLKTIPKEIRMRNLMQEKDILPESEPNKSIDAVENSNTNLNEKSTQENGEHADSVTLETTKENGNSSLENEEHTDLVAEATKENESSSQKNEEYMNSVALEITKENENSSRGNEELVFDFNQNSQFLTLPTTEGETEKPPTPAARKLSSPAFVQNEEYMSGDDLKQLSYEDIPVPTGFENQEYMNSDDVKQLAENNNSEVKNEEVPPVPAPRRRPVSGIENV